MTIRDPKTLRAVAEALALAEQQYRVVIEAIERRKRIDRAQRRERAG